MGLGKCLAWTALGMACASLGARAEGVTIKVEIEGVTQGLFQAVEGLRSESEVLVAKGDTTAGPGAVKWTHLILRRAYDPQLNGLCRWRQSVLDGSAQKRDGSIILFDKEGQVAARWVFHHGWPCRWEVPSVESSSVPPGLETVEIVHEGLTLED